MVSLSTNILAGTIVLVPALVPRRYFVNYLILMLLGGLPIWLMIATALGGRQSSFGLAMLMGSLLPYVAMSIVATLIRSLYLVVAMANSSDYRFGAQGLVPSRGGPFVMLCCQAIALGLMASLYFYYQLGFVTQGMQCAWLAFLLAAVLPSIAAIACLKRPDALKGGWYILRKCFYAAFCSGSMLLLLGSIVFASFVAQRAEAKAAGTSYCLQMSGGPNGNDQTVATWLHLSPLLLRADHGDGHTTGFHSVMFIESVDGGQILNWSYMALDFRPIGLPMDVLKRQMPIYCRPKSHFVRQLPLLRATPQPTVSLRITGQSYVIPKSYRPTAYAGDYPGLIFRAQLPAFTPIDRIGLLSVDDMVDVYFAGDPWWPEISAKVQAVQTEGYVDHGNQTGLYKCSSTFVKIGKDDGQFCEYDELGHLRTFIDCFSPGAGQPRMCQHYFVEATRSYAFRHSELELIRWRRMQQKLVALVDSWSQSESLPLPQH